MKKLENIKFILSLTNKKIPINQTGIKLITYRETEQFAPYYNDEKSMEQIARKATIK